MRCISFRTLHAQTPRGCMMRLRLDSRFAVEHETAQEDYDVDFVQSFA